MHVKTATLLVLLASLFVASSSATAFDQLEEGFRSNNQHDLREGKQPSTQAQLNEMWRAINSLEENLRHRLRRLTR